MKTFTAIALMSMGPAASVMAADFKGFVQDEKCSKVPAMKGNAACSQKCIQGGEPAVLVMPDGKIYKIANQDKIKAHAGMTVTVTGDLKGDTLTVDSVKM